MKTKLTPRIFTAISILSITLAIINLIISIDNYNNINTLKNKIKINNNSSITIQKNYITCFFSL